MTRPRLHLTAPRGWLNDPHGLRWHEGAYHVFHQWVPDSLAWAPGCHWGHAVGDDLLTWEHRGAALAPGDGDDGIWTGCVVGSGADALLLYTSVQEPHLALGRVRVATPDDASWDAWHKGPVVVQAPGDVDLVAFRDPVVLREGDGWRMLVGGGTADGTALALTWTSPDLRSWSYDGVAASRPGSQTAPVWTGAVWECPQLVEVDGHWLLLVSVWEVDVLHHVACAVGTLREGRFEADSWWRLAHGAPYAPSVFHDRDGRPCLVSWLRGVAGADDTGDGGGWTGCLSLPHVLSVRDGRPVAAPHPEVAAARVAAPVAGRVDLAAGPVDVEWAPGPAGGRAELRSGGEGVAVLRVGAGAVALERPGVEDVTMPWSGGPLRLVVDGPVLEVSSYDGLLAGAVGPADTLLPPDADDADDAAAGWTAWRLDPVRRRR